MENNTTLFEQLEKSIDLAKQVITMKGDDRKAYIDKLLKLYNEFHKIVFGITDEEGIIMANYEWVPVNHRYEKKMSINKVWNNAAKKFALENGFSIRVVKKLYSFKNTIDGYRENIFAPYTNSLYPIAWRYHYFTLEKKEDN